MIHNSTRYSHQIVIITSTLEIDLAAITMMLTGWEDRKKEFVTMRVHSNKRAKSSPNQNGKCYTIMPELEKKSRGQEVTIKKKKK
jgi:hypothetical protein